MIKEIWNVIDSISIYVELILFIFSTVGVFLLGKYSKNKKQRKIRKILGFKNTDICEIMVPIWQGNIEYNYKESKLYKKDFGKQINTYDYICKDEAESLLHIQNICNIAGFKSTLVLKSPYATDLNDANNKFLCGGPLSNIYLKRIFSIQDTSPFKFKRKFLFGTKTHSFSRENNMLFRDIEKEIPEDTDGRILFIENQEKSTATTYDEIPIREGFIILIKHTEDNRGSFFICFGNSALTSNKAVKCIIEDTDLIYNITKKHKKNFFILLKCSYNGDINFDKNDIIDLTEKMFGSN